jgi:hypothetical protein
LTDKRGKDYRKRHKDAGLIHMGTVWVTQPTYRILLSSAAQRKVSLEVIVRGVLERETGTAKEPPVDRS